MENQHVTSATVLVSFAQQWSGLFRTTVLNQENSNTTIRLVSESTDIVISLDAKDHRLYIGSSVRAESESEEEWESTIGKWNRPQSTLEQFAAADPLMSRLDRIALSQLDKTINIRDPSKVSALLDSIATIVNRYILKVLSDVNQQTK